MATGVGDFAGHKGAEVTTHPHAVPGPSIVTLTMNPALDVTTETEVVVPDHKMRCEQPRYDPGGGGINVARVAQVLGASVAAVFPAGGPNGTLVTDLLTRAGVPSRRVAIGQPTRESLTVTERSTGEQYRFILPGPMLTAAEQTECLNEVRAASAAAEFVVASGSLPPGVHDDYFQRVADVCRERGARLVLDTSGAALRHITSGVFMIKPSVRELRDWTGRDLSTEAQQVEAARELIDCGRAKVIVVSLGSSGAIAVTADTAHRYASVDVPLSSCVGAGDSMVAAITVGLSRGWSLDASMRFGIAAGAAMLMTPGTASCTRNDVERLFSLVAEPEDVAPAPSRGARR